eukprot:1591409-Rhodomonas_salina.2
MMMMCGCMRGEGGGWGRTVSSFSLSSSLRCTSFTAAAVSSDAPFPAAASCCPHTSARERQGERE